MQTAEIRPEQAKAEALERLLTQARFADIVIDTPGETDVQSVQEVLDPGDSSLGRFLNHLLFDESQSAEQRRLGFQRFLKDTQLSGHIRVTARKP